MCTGVGRVSTFEHMSQTYCIESFKNFIPAQYLYWIFLILVLGSKADFLLMCDKCIPSIETDIALVLSKYYLECLPGQQKYIPRFQPGTHPTLVYMDLNISVGYEFYNVQNIYQLGKVYRIQKHFQTTLGYTSFA
jgi:hypothetical protein